MVEPWDLYCSALTAFFQARKSWSVPWSRLRFQWGGSWLSLGQRLRPDEIAVTWDHTIQLDPSIRGRADVPWILSHELMHVLQWERGGLRFALDYVCQFLSRPIDRNTFEREADGTADDFERWRTTP